MKNIFKIEKYLPDTNQILVRFCNLNSNKSIDSYKVYSIDCDKLDLYNYDIFVESLMRMYGNHITEEQILSENILDSNIPEEIDLENFNIEDLVGRVLKNISSAEKEVSILKMRKIEL